VKSTHYFSAITLGPAGCIILGALLCVTPIEAQFHASGYDTPSMIDFESTNVVASESSTNVTLYLFRTGEFRTMSRINYITVAETAIEGEDYQACGGTLVFQPGEGYKSISIPLIADSNPESAKTFRLELSSSDPDMILVRNSARVTIEDGSTQVASIPRLDIERTDNGAVLLSWPKTSSIFVLESARACLPQSWQTVSAQPQLNGSRYEIQQETGGGLLIFRLRNQ